MEPGDELIADAVKDLAVLLDHHVLAFVSKSLQCFATLADKYQRRSADPKDLLGGDLLEKLLRLLVRCKPGPTVDGAPNVDAPTARTIVSLVGGLWCVFLENKLGGYEVKDKAVENEGVSASPPLKPKSLTCVSR